MSDRWLKPDFQEIGVAGECTAYAGTTGACQANSHDILTVDPLQSGEANDGAIGDGRLTTTSSP